MNVEGDAAIDELTYLINGCAMRVHTTLGPGLLESAYRACLKYELEQKGLLVECEGDLPIRYGAVELDIGYRLDLVVERRVVLELKAVESLAPIHKAQLISYLKLGGYATGLLINFHVEHLRDGIHRLYPPRYQTGEKKEAQEETKETEEYRSPRT
jgi:GxxExxY protein